MLGARWMRCCCPCGVRLLSMRVTRLSHSLVYSRQQAGLWVLGFQSAVKRGNLAIGSCRHYGATKQENNEEEDVASLLKSIGVKDNLRKKEVVVNLKSLVHQARALLGGEVDRATGKMVYSLATRFGGSPERSTMLLCYICSRKIANEHQLKAALEYLKANPVDPIDIQDFEHHCGVGVVVSKEEIAAEVKKVVEQHRSAVLKDKHQLLVGKLMAAVRKNLKWSHPKLVRLTIDQELEKLGSEVSSEASEGRQPFPSESGQREIDPTETTGPDSLIGEARRFHKPGENYLTEGYVVTLKTIELLKQHLKETGGKVVTRFPPEPNGILHIGHAMAINFNFGYAKAHGGICYLRYDDTNPEKEEEKFIRGIQEMVEWLGHKPYKITFASDYFSQLYDYATELVRRGQAYVCHQHWDDMKGHQHQPPPSPWRNRPVEESLRLFEEMKNGKFKEGEVTLRMKLTMEDSKQDPVAYRIKYTPHPRTGDQWCIYPTYDFAHCLCDSIENITHSLCTREFQMKRSSYYWLCNVLDVYCPVQWEYGRLNVRHTVVSKRKIQKLIDAGIVSGWDDPRLFTLTALRRRGFPPEAINRFCEEYGVMTSDGAIYPELLESYVRDELNKTAPRAMAVLNPLKVVITNFPHSGAIDLEVPNFPSDPSRGSHTVPFDRVIYIEQSDFRDTPEAGYHRLAPNQPVGLNHASCVLSVQDTVKDATGMVTELYVTCQKLSECECQPKAFIHWVSNPLKCTVKLYDKLLLHESLEEVAGEASSIVNPNSLQVVENAFVDRSVVSATPLSKFQFERLGYFSVDFNITEEKMVFNRTVTLREDSSNPVPVY